MKILWTILLALWIIGGSMFAKKTWCGTSSKPTKKAAATSAAAAAKKGGCDYSLMIKTGDFNVKALDNFQFKKDESKLIVPSDDLATSLKKISEYLKANPDRILKLDAHYHAKEKDADALGMARANSIKSHLVSELGFSADQINLSATNVKAACFKGSKSPLLKGATVTLGEK